LKRIYKETIFDQKQFGKEVIAISCCFRSTSFEKVMNCGDIIISTNQLKQRLVTCSSNAEKRVLYSDSELLLIQVEKLLSTKKQSVENTEGLKSARDDLIRISASIPLNYIKRESSSLMRFINKCDEILRLIGVWLLITIAALFIALPCILLSPLDFLLVKIGIIDVFSQISVQCKLFLSRTIIRISGTHMEIVGADRNYFGKDCVLACFSHSSSLDGFLTTAAIPVTALTVVRNGCSFMNHIDLVSP
jgi:hypothetical protein